MTWVFLSRVLLTSSVQTIPSTPLLASVATHTHHSTSHPAARKPEAVKCNNVSSYRFRIAVSHHNPETGNQRQGPIARKMRLCIACDKITTPLPYQRKGWEGELCRSLHRTRWTRPIDRSIGMCGAVMGNDDGEGSNKSGTYCHIACSKLPSRCRLPKRRVYDKHLRE